mmetsp:Transcript_32100/g.80594  ORF Transcript_32100/g.80594 Transcript_32100/m.80594 type:complete len:213 (-) Transcript_32100:2177-2815(-)
MLGPASARKPPLLRSPSQRSRFMLHHPAATALLILFPPLLLLPLLHSLPSSRLLPKWFGGVFWPREPQPLPSGDEHQFGEVSLPRGPQPTNVLNSPPCHRHGRSPRPCLCHHLASLLRLATAIAVPIELPPHRDPPEHRHQHLQTVDSTSGRRRAVLTTAMLTRVQQLVTSWTSFLATLLLSMNLSIVHRDGPENRPITCLNTVSAIISSSQ